MNRQEWVMDEINALFENKSREEIIAILKAHPEFDVPYSTETIVNNDAPIDWSTMSEGDADEIEAAKELIRLLTEASLKTMTNGRFFSRVVRLSRLN